MGLFNFLKSSILSKIVMAVTGVILVGFIVGHTVGNMQVFLGKDVFNTYAHFLQSTGELLWIVRGVLFLSLVLHIITAIRLKLMNAGAKPLKYNVKKYVVARLSSRTMIWTGIMIFAFLAYHLAHFTLGTADPEIYGHQDYYASNADFYLTNSDGDVSYNGETYGKMQSGQILLARHDAHRMVIEGFKKPVASIIYLIGVILLGFHMAHAIQSAFQTLGFAGPKFTPWMIRTSNLFSFLIVIMLISIPITILLGLVK